MNWQFQQLDILSRARQADLLRNAEHERLVRFARAHHAPAPANSTSTTSALSPSRPLATPGATRARLARQVS